MCGQPKSLFFVFFITDSGFVLLMVCGSFYVILLALIMFFFYKVFLNQNNLRALYIKEKKKNKAIKQLGLPPKLCSFRVESLNFIL